jgi:hypothetical protein
MTSVLLKRVGRLWMTECMDACFVCSGWGSPAVVHAAWMAGEKCKQVAHSRIHKPRCDWWVGSGQSFLEVCGVQAGAQRLDRCRMRVVSSLT